jgi:two-component system sensor histidine kinase KdpD
VVAFILLVTVSLIAMFFDILPVLLAAVLSALVWNFFFIPPKFTFAIHNTEDVLLFFMYFIIASVNAVLTFKIRQIEKQANKKEEKENTLKLYNTLLNSLSHELRTPISTIIGATDNLQTDDNKLSTQQKNELLSEISIASLRLNGQVENLLNMSRLESGFIQPKKDWCDVNELIYDVVNRLKENLGTKIIQVSIKENLPLFKLDVGLMEQVLHNLIYNATLYIAENGEIKITADSKNDNLILVIEDNGTGFPADEIDKVFEKFYRLKNAKPGGTGLGLSIVKGFVEAHNGTIQLENKASGGAKFTITIPTEISFLNNLKND